MELTRHARITNPRGLHARPCHAIASAALAHKAELRVRCNGTEVNGKSILELMTLQAAHGCILELTARGEDAEVLLAALDRLIAGGFNETD